MIGNRGDMSAFAESFVREDIFMQQARNTAEELGTLDPSPAVGGLQKFLVETLRAKSIVEIGTGSGVSGLWLFAGASPETVLTSIDIEREHAASARAVFEEAGISSQRFRLITGTILEVVGKLADKNYDLVVLRPAADLMELIHEAYRLLRPGGILFIDHALSGGKVADPTQRDFDSISRRDGVRAVREDSRWSCTVLPVGSGVLLATKL